MRLAGAKDAPHKRIMAVNDRSATAADVKVALTTEEAFFRAVDHCNAQRYAEADQLCTAIIQEQPRHVNAINLLGIIAQRLNRHNMALLQFQKAIEIDSGIAALHHNLGISLYQSGRHQEAVAALERAVALDPDANRAAGLLQQIRHAGPKTPNPARHALEQGLKHHNCGDFDQAINWYGKCIELEPDNPLPYSNMGVALQSRGDHEAAAKCYGRAIAVAPDYVEAHFNLGVLHQEQGHMDQALIQYEKTIAIKPDHSQAHLNSGVIHQGRGNLQLARQCYQHAIASDPDHAKAHYNLGNIFRAENRFNDAIDCFRAAIASDPDYGDAHYNLGNAARKSGDFEEAAACYRRAIAIKPDHFEALGNLGATLHELGRLDAAIQTYKRSLESKSDSPVTLNNIGVVYQDQGRFSDAATAYRKSLALAPGDIEALSNLGAALQEQGNLEEAMAQYQRAIDIDPEFAKARSNLLMCFQYVPGQNMKRLFELHKKWGEEFPGNRAAVQFTHSSAAQRKKRLRVGLVSADLGRHPVGYLVAGFITHRPRNMVELICYSDRIADDLSEEFATLADHWFTTRSLTDTDLARRIHADSIDILIDLGGHSARNRLGVFAARPAPVQVSWCGYVSTTGLSAMDWFISDHHSTTVAEEKYHTERIIRLPDSWISYTPPDYAPPCAPRLTKSGADRLTLCNFGNPVKINRPLLELWGRILNSCQQADLLLIYRGMDDPANIKRIKQGLAAHGISSRRVTMLGGIPHKDLLVRYHTVDLALDTTPYSGGVTTLEALWMGVPVVTLRGDTFAGRHATSILRTLGRTELIAEDGDAYVKLVVELATNPERLRRLQEELREQMAGSPLCDHEKFARDMADALQRIWEMQ